MNARDVHVLRHRSVSFAEDAVSRGTVAGFPMPDVIRGFSVGSHEWGSLLDRLVRIDDGGERIVLNVHRGDAVGGGITARGNYRRDLLRLIDDAIRGQHHLRV